MAQRARGKTPAGTIFSGLTTADRVDRAKEKTSKLVDNMRHWIALRECRLGLFQAKVHLQIPRSYAANAFNLMTEALFRSEVVRLCTFWDKPSLDRESIPTVIALVADKEVRRMLAREAYDAFAQSEPSILGDHGAEETKVLQQILAADAKDQGRYECKSCLSNLQSAKLKASGVLDSAEFRGLLAIRDHQIAHSLKPSQTASDVMKDVRYGHEAVILDKTLAIVQSLHLAINSGNFDFEERKSYAARDAAELWANCSFSFGNS